MFLKLIKCQDVQGEFELLSFSKALSGGASRAWWDSGLMLLLTHTITEVTLAAWTTGPAGALP